MRRPEDQIDQALKRMLEGNGADLALEPYADPLRRMEALRPSPDRDPGAATAGRQAFLEEAASQAVSRPALSRPRVRTFEGRKEIRPMSAVIGLLVALFLMFGGGATALAAQDALPHNALYGVKMATEDLRFKMTRDPAQQIDLLEDWADRRVQEMDELTRAGEGIPMETTLRLKTQLAETLRIAAQLQDADLASALLRLQTRLEIQLRSMEQLRTADPSGVALQTAQQAMIRTHAEIQGALEDPAAFRARYGAGRPADAPGQPEVDSGEPPVTLPGAGGQGSGQGNGSNDGQGSGERQNPDAGQGPGFLGGPGDGTCTCTPRGDGYLVCTAACLQDQNQYQGGQGAGSGYGTEGLNCACTAQTDGSLLCPATCESNLYLWSTPGPHGNGQGGSGK
jgi:hypothetical protein